MNVLGEGHIEFEGEQRIYRIIRRDYEGAPRFFIGYNHGFPFISDEVPEKFREPMIFHELYEFEKLKDKSGRCVASLKEELKLLSPHDIREYIEFRKGVLEELKRYLRRNEPKSEFLPELKKSIEFLAGFNL